MQLRLAFVVLVLAFLASSLLLLAGAAPAFAQAVPSADWPSVDTVLADTQGSDPHDTAARQRAALLVLADMVRDSAGPKQGFNLPEPLRQQLKTYSAASQDIYHKVVAELDPPEAPKGRDSPRAKWYSLSTRYAQDPALREALTQRYLSSTTAGVVRQAQKRDAAQRASTLAQSTHDNEALQERQARRDALWRVEMTSLAMVLITYLAAFALLLTWRLMRRPPPPADAPGWSFQAGGNGAVFSVRTGIVSDHHKRGDVHFSGHGGSRHQAAQFWSRVVVEQEFRLLGAQGQADLPVQLSDLDLPIFNKQRVSVILGVKAGGHQERVVRLVNHSANQASVTVRRNVVADWGLVCPWFVPGLLCLPVAAVVPDGGGALALLAGGALLLLASVVWAVNHRLVADRMSDKLDALASDVLASPPPA